MIVCSLNEVEAYGRRAARGAGMDWGLAEEAGKGARWLAERGLPGIQLLVALLKINDGRDYRTIAPLIVDRRWQSPNGRLCPICAGAALSDRIALLNEGADIHMGGVSYPLLLAPFLDCSWLPYGAAHELRWAHVRILISNGDLVMESENKSAHLGESVDEVRISGVRQTVVEPTHQPGTAGVRVPLSVWNQLNVLAKRTYVPASEESRDRGAGAGRTDND